MAESEAGAGGSVKGHRNTGKRDDCETAQKAHKLNFGLTLLRRWARFYSMADSVQVQKNLKAAMKEALRIQGRFVAEPLFARTGRGYLKSEGVTTIHKIKANLRRRTSLKPG
jgi:hypothetical protein